MYLAIEIISKIVYENNYSYRGTSPIYKGGCIK